MAKGTLYIRIGLPPRVVSGDCLVSSHCGLTARYLRCRCAYPMSRDWGCISMSYRSPYALPFVYAALGAILLPTIRSADMVLHVMTPPMVGSTWPRVRLTLESDCLPALFRGPPRSVLLWTDCPLSSLSPRISDVS